MRLRGIFLSKAEKQIALNDLLRAVRYNQHRWGLCSSNKSMKWNFQSYSLWAKPPHNNPRHRLRCQMAVHRLTRPRRPKTQPPRCRYLFRPALRKAVSSAKPALGDSEAALKLDTSGVSAAQRTLKPYGINILPEKQHTPNQEAAPENQAK